MQHNAAINNRAFIVSLSSRFIDSSLHQRDSVVRELLSFGDAAIGLRQRDRLLEVGEALSGLPLPESIRAVGAYYIGYAEGKQGALDLEYAINHAPPRYRARAILSLAGLARNTSDDAWPQLYAEAISQARRAQDVYTAIHAHKMLAIRRAVEGDHWRAIDDLENLWPMLRLIAKQDPATYFDVLNSLAVELQEVGRTDEAARTIAIVSASPLIAVYGEWQQTADEIAEAQAQPLMLVVPALKREARAVAVVAVLIVAFIKRTKCPLDARREQRINLSAIPNRAAIRAGPRGPPTSILV